MKSGKQIDSIKILNIDILNTDIESLLYTYESGCLFTPNIDHLVLLQRDEQFYHAYKTAEYVILDSQVIYLLSKLWKRSFMGRIAGSDFFPRFCEYHKKNAAVKIFVLGGLDGVAKEVGALLNKRYDRNMVVDSYSPPLGFENSIVELEKIVSRINTSGANTLAVGFGAPKQEKWIFQNRKRLTNITRIMAIGATLDFMAGKQKRAPIWMQKNGLEWFYRLLHEPIRLSKRYLIRDVQFFYYLSKGLFGIYRNPFEKYPEELKSKEEIKEKV
ncbi:MAG: WecB/TagA/CpsF family glycosyltransferase [Kovacikia sp.]